MTPLAQAVLKTVTFFDAEDMALTLPEIKNYLVSAPDLPERVSSAAIATILQGELSGTVSAAEGFYFLAGRNRLLALRKERYKISLGRFRKARRFLRGLRFMPYLEAVAISGSQALLNSQENSDIDLFLLTKKNRIWLTRLLVSFYFQLLGQRRYGIHIKSRFCLNHYICEGKVITQDQNLYTAVEYASLIPVFGRQEIVEFWERNSWLRGYLYHPLLETQSTFFNFESSRLQRVLEYLLDFTVGPLLNWWSGIYQKRRIKLQDFIMVSDEELSFHPGSRGQRVLSQYQEKLRRFGVLDIAAN